MTLLPPGDLTGDRGSVRAILVIANRTCPCPALADAVAGRATDAPLDVLVVAPALNSRLRHWCSDVDDAISRARARVELAVTELHERGVIDKARARFPVPVTHLVSDYGLVAAGAPA